MSHHPHNTSKNGSSSTERAFLWLAILLGLALLSFVTIVAIRNNPIYSNRNTNGISKYQFIEECKDRASDAGALTIAGMGTEVTLKQLVEQTAKPGPKDTIKAELPATTGPVEVSANTEELPDGGWKLALPVLVSVTSGKQTNILGQLPLQCAYTKKDHKLVAQLQPPNQGQGQ